MTPADLADRINDLVDNATESFSAAARAAQNLLVDKLDILIRQIEIKNGLIVPTAENLKLVRQIDDAIREVLLNSDYSKSAKEFVSNYSDIGNIHQLYFEGIAEAFVPNEAMFNRFRTNAISLTEESLAGAGLDSQFIEPIRKILNDNITSGASFSDMKKQITDFIQGGDGRLGRLESYAGQITRDALNQFSRNYHEQISQDLGLEWFLYRGGKVKDTRPFCRERAGKYYHRTEIEEWPNADWAGKIPGTSASTIYSYAGGFNCMHYIVGVDTSVVPKSDLARIHG